MSARRLFQSSRSRRRSLTAVVVRAYVSLSYKIEQDDTPAQLMTRLVVPLPGILASIFYFVFAGLLDPICAAVSAAWSGLMARLRDRYIRFLVWLGAEPPPGYEYLLNREFAMEVVYA